MEGWNHEASYIGMDLSKTNAASPAGTTGVGSDMLAPFDSDLPSGSDDVTVDSDEVACSEVVEEDTVSSFASASHELLPVGLGDVFKPQKAGLSRFPTEATEQSIASVFDSTTGPDMSVDSVDIENLVDHLEVVDYVSM